MKIQVFSQYYNLAQAGRVKPLACPNHKSDYIISEAIYWLMHKEQNDKIVLYCTACGYEQTAGIEFYENIIKLIKKVEYEQL
jgi:hypothetical protein